MFREHDTVILTDAVKGDEDTNLLRGDVGCIIHIHGNSDAYVVEFMALDGETIDIATVTPEQVRAVTARDITHARETAPTP
jgi:hypothetical protein